jgi:hypothetical protein
MKHFYFLCVFTLFIHVHGFSQATVEKIPGLDGGNFTSVVEFKDTLYATTVNTDIYFSADKGTSWQKDERFAPSWNSVASNVVEPNIFLKVDTAKDQLYIGGSSGLMIYSSGAPVQPTTIPTFFGERGSIGDIVITDTTLYASYRYSKAIILTSTDGGLNWTEHEETSRFMNKLAMTADGKLLGVSGDNLYLSDAGGTNFTELTIPTERFSLITDLHVSGSTFYITTYLDGVLFSTDEGASWTTLQEQSAFSITELSNGNLVIGGLNAHVYVSSDDGTTWTDTDLELESSLQYSHGIKEIIELSDGTLVASLIWTYVLSPEFTYPSPAGIMTSADGGITWTVSNSGLSAIEIPHAYGHNGDFFIFASAAGVYKWDGETSAWAPIGTPPDLRTLDFFNNATSGWPAVGSGGPIAINPASGELNLVGTKFSLRLDSETNTWIPSALDPYEFLKPVSLGFLDDGTGFIHETNAFTGIYTSTDAVDWATVEDNPNGANITKFMVGGENLAYFDNYGFDGGIGAHYSSDGGATWNFVQEGREGTYLASDAFLDMNTKEILTPIQVFSPEVKWFIERFDIEESTYSEQDIVTDIEISDPSMGTIHQLANGALILHISGTVEQASGPLGYFSLQEGTFTQLAPGELPVEKASDIMIVGDGEMMFQFGTDMYLVDVGGNATHTEDLDYGLPSAFTIIPNYPNPFNPSTQLRFELNQPAATQITVYNMLGQQVKVMNLGNLTTGTHEVTFNAASLSSGIYLYTIQSGNAVRSGRMTLLK